MYSGGHESDLNSKLQGVSGIGKGTPGGEHSTFAGDLPTKILRVVETPADDPRIPSSRPENMTTKARGGYIPEFLSAAEGD